MPRISIDHAIATVPRPDEGLDVCAGAGTLLREGFLNTDISPLPGTAFASDVTRMPLPDGSCRLVVCEDLLEHVDVQTVMPEMYRVLRPGGLLAIQTCHFTSRDYFMDPTHLRAFSVRSFEFFAKTDLEQARDYYFEYQFASVEYTGLQFHQGKLAWNRLIEPLVNSSPRALDFYELTGLSRIFPASNVVTVLRK